MKSILIVFILTLSTLLAQESPILDRLIITDTSTIWIQHEGYESSDFKISGVEYFKEIDTTYFIKNYNTGYLLSAKDGSAYRVINLPDLGWKKEVTWDIPYDDINLIYGFEFDDDKGDIHFRISSKKDNKIDSLKSITYEPDYNHTWYELDDYPHLSMLALSMGKLILNGNYFKNTGPYHYERYKTIFFDVKNDKVNEVYGLKPPNSAISSSINFILNFNDNIKEDNGERIDGEDSYNLYDLNSKGSVIMPNQLKVGSMNTNSISYFLINDSLSIFTTNDSLIVYNFRSSTKLKTYDISSRDKFGDYYYHQQSKSLIFNSFSKLNDEKFVTAIHLPSLNIIKDTINDKPYLGKILTQMENGKHLSFGEGGFIYKFDFDLGLNYCKSDFSYDILANNKYKFSDLSKGPIVKWNWDFGDGTTSELRNPQHKYSKNGIYDITLIVENEFGLKDTLVKSLESIDKLNSLFTADILQGKVPHSVEFKNRSSDNAVRFIWNFGDGTSSIEPNPTHIFNTPGTYGISLTVFDSEGKFDIRYLENLIIVEE